MPANEQPIRQTGCLKVFAIGLAILIGAIVALAAAYERATYRHRYKLTLNVEVDGHTHSAAGVIQVTYRPDFVPGRPFAHYQSTVTGEAVSLDLGARGNVFALLSGPTHEFPYLLHERLFNLRPGVRPWDERDRHAQALAKQKTGEQVPFAELPMLLTFRSLADPTSALQVTPTDLSPAFGAGARLASATIQMTDEAVSRGIAHTLPWLPAAHKRGGSLDGTRFPDIRAPLVSRLGTGAFWAGTE